MMEKTGVNTFRNGGCLEPGSNSMSPLIFSPSRILQSNGDVYPFGDKFKLKPMLRARPIFYWVTFRAKSPRTFDIHISVQRLTVNHVFFLLPKLSGQQSVSVRRDPSLCDGRRT